MASTGFQTATQNALTIANEIRRRRPHDINPERKS
jgi:hypothetical protein